VRYPCLMAAIVGTGCFTSSFVTSVAQTPARLAASESGTVEFENETIAVVRMHMAPHAKTSMHDIPSPRLVIWLTEAHLKDTGADGRVNEYNRSAGSTDWIEPRRHMGENLSDHDLDFLAVIPKAAAADPRHGGAH
jgi:hypothetical protein